MVIPDKYVSSTNFQSIDCDVLVDSESQYLIFFASFCLVIKHYRSLIGFYGKREYLVSCTRDGSLTKTRVVRWLIYLEYGTTWQAVHVRFTD